MKDIYLFEKSAESIIGAEIDGLRDYIIQKYRLDKDKYKIKFNEFQRLVQEWVNYESKKNNDSKSMIDENVEDTQRNIYNASLTSNIQGEYHEENDRADRQAKTKFKLLLRLKIEKHFEKIKEIFENHSEEFQEKLAEEKIKQNQPLAPSSHAKSLKNLSEVKSKKDKIKAEEKSEGEGEGEGEDNGEGEESEEEEKEENKPKKEKSEIAKDDNAIVIPIKTVNQRIETKVKLSKMDKVLNDIAYLIGLGILTVQESNTNNKAKRSSAKAIDEFIHFIWKKKHEFILEQKKIFSKDKPVLKNGVKKEESKLENKPKSNKDFEKSDNEEDEEENHNHPTDAKKSQLKSTKSNAKAQAEKPADKTKADPKKQQSKEPKKDKKEEKKDNKNEKNDDKGKNNSKEKEIKLDGSDDGSNEGEESEHSDSNGSGEGSESEQEEDFYEDVKERAILFEDEKYNRECHTTTLAYEEFQEYMEAFVDYACSNKSMLDNKDTNGRDLAHREQDAFKIIDFNHEFDDELSDDNHEEEIVTENPKDKLSKKLQKTISEYEDLLNKNSFKNDNERLLAQKLLKTLKSQFEGHTNQKPVPKIPEESVEERREKSLQELFSFYAKQHIPPGLPFEKLEETLQTINVGELVIFCKDFGIDLSRNELMLIYKKESDNNHPHKFKQFMQSLRKICELRHGKKIQKLKNRIKEINNLLGVKSIKPSEASEGEKSSGHSSEGEGEGSESENESEGKSKASKKTEDKKSSKDPKNEINKKVPEKPDANKKGDVAKDKKEDLKSKPTEKVEDPKVKDKSQVKQSDKSKIEKASKASGDEGEGEGSDSEGSESEAEGEGEGEEVKIKAAEKEAEKNKLIDEKQIIEDEISALELMTSEQIYEDFMLFLEIDIPHKYKHKAKGLRLAFDVKDTKSRIPLGVDNIKSKIFRKSKLSAAEIKEKVLKMKEVRVERKNQQELAEKQKYDKNREILKQIHTKLRHDKLVKPQDKVSYSDMKIRNMGIPTWETKHTKITLDVLKNMHYSDFNIDDDDDFKPTDILDEEEIKELERQDRKAKASKSPKKVIEKGYTDTEQRVKRGTQQINISQLTSSKQNKSSIKLSNNKVGPINGAYDYTQGALGGSQSKRDKLTKRDERSVPKVSHSFQADYLNANLSSIKNPKSKQAIIKDRLKLVGSQQDLKKNMSMHYRRSTQAQVNSMNIHDSYTVGISSNKIPKMKQQMKDRINQIESKTNAKEKQNLNNIMMMHDNHISKGLKTIDKRYKS